jgi:hypothetical protein
VIGVIARTSIPSVDTLQGGHFTTLASIATVALNEMTRCADRVELLYFRPSEPMCFKQPSQESEIELTAALPYEKTDYLLRAPDPLFQKEVISMEEYNLRRGLFKRHVKRFYYACRRFDEGLRGRMDAYEAITANGATKIKGNGAHTQHRVAPPRRRVISIVA